MILLVLSTAISRAGNPTITKIWNHDDCRYVHVKISSRMSEDELLDVAAAVKKAIPKHDGETCVRFRLPQQDNLATWASWASVTLAEGREPDVRMNGFSLKELAELADPTKEQWLIAGEGKLYTITIADNLATMKVDAKHFGKITHESTDLRYIDGWLYDNSDHRYRFSDGTKAMHIQYWLDLGPGNKKWSGNQVAMRLQTPQSAKRHSAHENPLGIDIHKILGPEGYLAHGGDVSRSINVWKHRSSSATITGQFEGQGNGMFNRRTVSLEMSRDGNVMWKSERMSIKQGVLYIETADGWREADVDG